MIVDSVLSILVRFLQYDIFLYVKSLIWSFLLRILSSCVPTKKNISPCALCLLYHGMSMLNGEAFYVFFYDKKQLHVEPRKVHMYVCIRLHWTFCFVYVTFINQNNKKEFLLSYNYSSIT